MSEVPFERLMRLVTTAGLPGVTKSTSYGKPSLKVADKQFAGWKDATTLPLRIPMGQKLFLLEVAPEIYFETDHYKGSQWLLIRLDVISDEELSQRLIDAWKFRAPKKLAALLGG
jgi:hypothetical protein